METVIEFYQRILKVRKREGQVSTKCPLHEDKDASLSVNLSTGKWKCHAGCGHGNAYQFSKALGMEPPDDPSYVPSEKKSTGANWIIYPYENSKRDLVYQVIRKAGKKFIQRRPDDKGNWIYNLKGITRIPYRLPESLEHEGIVFIVEGEKCVETMREKGLVATCNSEGSSGHWGKETHGFYFKDKSLVILPDNDSNGLKHAHSIAKIQKELGSPSVKLLELPGLPEKGDIVDWFEAGHTVEELWELVEATPEYENNMFQIEEEEEKGSGEKNSVDRQLEILLKNLKEQKEINVPKVVEEIKNLLVHIDESLWTHYLDQASNYVKISKRTLTRQIKEIRDKDKKKEVSHDPTYADVAEMFLQKFRQDDLLTLRYYQGEFYFYDDIHYRHLHHVILEAEINRFLQNQPSLRSWAGGRNVGYIIKNVIAQSLLPSEQNAPFWLIPGEEDQGYSITLNNGILNLKKAYSGEEDCLSPHTPEYFDVVALNFDYHPGAKCPLWMKFLEETHADPQVRDVIQEFFGYCLDMSLNLHKCVILEGVGRNGKGVISSTLSNMLGRENISAVGLERFGDKFALHSTLNKLANIVPDLEQIDRVAEGTFKYFVAQDEMQFEKKYGDSFTAKPTAKLLISTNNFPRFRDRTDGVWRRIILIKCLFQVSEENQDNELSDKIRDELPGIFNWALEGLKRLHERHRFTSSNLIGKWVKEYKEEQNPAFTYLKENYIPISGGEVTTESVFKEYRQNCYDFNVQPLNHINFGKEVFKTFPGVKKSERKFEGHRYYVYAGLVKSAASGPLLSRH